jgi:hypothetical protein
MENENLYDDRFNEKDAMQIFMLIESQISDSKFWLNEWKNIKYAALSIIMIVLFFVPSISLTLFISVFILISVFNKLSRRERYIIKTYYENINKAKADKSI